MNDLLANFVTRIENRYSIDKASMGIADWICANTTLRGRPYSFARYPFQRAIADDLHPNVDVMKCSQVGLTEIQIRKALAMVRRHRGIAGIYTIAEEKLFKRVSQTRVQPIVKADKVFNLEEDEGSVRSMGTLQFGTSFLYLTAATEGDATSTSADFLFNDEVDLTDQTMLALFNSRLQNSDMKIRQRFSTPTHVSYGIHLGFEGSDQHEYMCKCDVCGHWNIPEFDRRFVDLPGLPDSVEDLTEIDDNLVDGLDLLNSLIVCEKCHAPLDLGREDNREWVPRHPGRSHSRGYRVTPFTTSRLGIQYIVTQLLDYKRRDFLRGFHNTVLGMPYTAGDARLEVGVIESRFTPQASVPQVGSDVPVFIGIDVGQICHITMSDANRNVFMFDTVHSEKLVEHVETLLKIYNIVGGCIDRNPYTPTANAIRDLSEGRILPVEYAGKGDFKLVEVLVGTDPVGEPLKEVTHIQANRTGVLDDMARHVRRKETTFSGYTHQKQTIVEHLRDQVRVEEPEKPAVWQKLTGKDHYSHSLGYLFLSIKIADFKAAISSGEVRSVCDVAVVTVQTPSVYIPGHQPSKKRNNGSVFGDGFSSFYKVIG